MEPSNFIFVFLTVSHERIDCFDFVVKKVLERHFLIRELIIAKRIIVGS
jgi:hypothetical protein